ncbi:MAG: diguanylate cyclase domain-containing protein [Acetivibrio ethanolgignens]
MKIWEFFENLDEFVYAADMDSYEILYMNKKAREAYGFTSNKGVIGKKCYEILQKSNAPCAICTNHLLTPGNFKEWRYYNPVIHKHLELKDTMIEVNKRRCRIELAIDVSMRERQNEAACRYENLETLVNESIRIALMASTPNKSLEIILEHLGKILKGERAYIFERNTRGGDDNTYEWVAEGITPERENLQNLPPEVCANWYQNFKENKNIVIEDLEDIREEDPLQYANLKRQNICSIVVVPLYDERKVIGFYGIDNPPKESMDYIQNILQIIGHFIVSSLKRRDLIKQLERISYLDQLTKLGNRFAMNEYALQMGRRDSIGVVYCDITGLKRVNDTEGHEAGDRLILRACEGLEIAFHGYGLFRIGGDELLALCPQIKEDELKNKIEKLKKDLQEKEVVMAIGAIWEKENSIPLDKLLSLAEELMNKDKKAYYKALGEKSGGGGREYLRDCKEREDKR